MTVADKVLPHSIDAEQAVLGAILVSKDALETVDAILKPEHFYRHAHSLLYGAMLALATRNVVPDHVTVKEELVRRGQLDEIGLGYLAGLGDGVPRATNVEYYAGIVKEKAMLRGLIYASNQMASRAYDASDDAQAVLNAAEQVMVQLSTDVVPGDLVSADAMAREVYPVLEKLMSERRPVTGLATGLFELDRRTRGLQPGDLVIIAARPSQGKTALVTQLSLEIGKREPVAFFSLEMSRLAIEMRAIALMARVDAHQMQCGQLSSDEQERVGKAVQSLSELKWHVDDTPALTPLQLRSKARRMKAQHGLSAIVVDYLQLMGGGQRFENRTQEVSALSRTMKAIAKELNVPAIVLSQLSRKSEDRADKRPQLSDLRESGAIEQDADVVMFLYRKPAPGGYEPVTELIIAKQRNGPIGTIELAFVKEQMRFAELETR